MVNKEVLLPKERGVCGNVDVVERCDRVSEGGQHAVAFVEPRGWCVFREVRSFLLKCSILLLLPFLSVFHDVPVECAQHFFCLDTDGYPNMSYDKSREYALNLSLCRVTFRSQTFPKPNRAVFHVLQTTCRNLAGATLLRNRLLVAKVTE